MHRKSVSRECMAGRQVVPGPVMAGAAAGRQCTQQQVLRIHAGGRRQVCCTVQNEKQDRESRSGDPRQRRMAGRNPA